MMNETAKSGSRVRAALTSPLFLVFSILMTLTTIVEIVAQMTPILEILLTIACWVAYGAAMSKKEPMGTSGLVLASGTLRAVKIVVRILAIILIVLTVFFLVLGILQMWRLVEFLDEKARIKTIEEIDAEVADFMHMKIPGIGQFIKDYIDWYDGLGEMPMGLGALFSFLFFLLFGGAFVAGVILLVLGFTFYTTVHDFAKSLCEYEKKGMSIRRAKSASVWMMVLGILSALSIAGIPTGAALIVGSVWIRKTLV